MGHKHEHGHERKHRHERSERSRRRTRKWLLFALLVVVILAAWLICCNENIKDAWDVLSGGGASGNKTETSGKETVDVDDKTPTPTVASTPNTDVTPTEALKGADTGDTISITVDGKKVSIAGSAIEEKEFLCEDSAKLLLCVESLKKLPVKDSTSIVLQDATGDYNVSEQIRKILLENGWDYTERSLGTGVEVH